jgi:AcrR family transcriptional regulator
VAVSANPNRRPRRRRTREDAEREILEAAERVLAERPFEDLTVSAVMDRTTLSRKAFYVYFADRYELLTRLVEPLRTRGDAVMRGWQEGDAVADGRPTIHGIASLYAEHGVVLKALHDAASRHPEARRVWEQFTEPVIALIAERLRSEVDAGRIAPLDDPAATARALVGMNLYAFFEQLAGKSGADVDAVVDTLNEVWDRALWRAAPPSERE